MKRILLFFLLIAMTEVSGQNEFAAAAFYSDFKKIYHDAQSGFNLYKGEKRSSDFEELATEFNTKQLLPLADSGKIVFPNSDNRPFVVYFFEPHKLRLKIDQRAMYLREALQIAFEKPLFLRAETILVNNHPFTNSYLFTDPEDNRPGQAEFRLSIYYKDKLYHLSLEIRGKNE